ncbi:MAG: iron chelate uptake ABC transporter family permease subunit [Pseudomonadota bacterium]
MIREPALRIGRYAFLLNRRAIIVGITLAVLALAFAMIATISGRYPTSPRTLWAALTGNADTVARMIVIDHRLPRILTAIGAGAAFGMAGAMFQTMLRNPLASPDVIGFSAGASCGALAALIMFGTAFVLPGALIGALLTALTVIGLAWRQGIQPYRLILVGIGASLTLSALADLMMSRLDVLTAAEMAKWLIGTLNARNWADVTLVWAGLVILMPVALWLQFALSRMAMDDDLVTGLGLALSPLRLAVTFIGVALVALAVSVAGPLPFVAFVSGPIARRLVKGARPALLSAALIGALVTLLADTAARAVPMVHLPAGVFTAVIGAPVLMWLLVVQFNKGKI